MCVLKIDKKKSELLQNGILKIAIICSNIFLLYMPVNHIFQNYFTSFVDTLLSTPIISQFWCFKNKESMYKEVSRSLRLKFYHFKTILSWEGSTEQLLQGQLLWISRLVDLQQPQIPIIKGEKQTFVATTAQVILLDQSLKQVYFQRF